MTDDDECLFFTPDRPVENGTVNVLPGGDGRERDNDRLQAKVLIAMLVERRKALGISQSELARRLSISQSTLSQFEAGKDDPYLSTLMRYATEVGAPIRPEVVPQRDERTAANLAEIFGAMDSVTTTYFGGRT